MTKTSFLESLYQEDIYKIYGKVLVIISKSWESISDDEKKLLEKILSAVKLNLAAVQIISCSEFDVNDFKSYIPSHIIAFGASLKGPFKKYEQLSLEGINVILVDELSQLDDGKKRNLWLTLKQVFQS